MTDLVLAQQAERIIDWMQSTALHDIIISSTWLWPALETVHFIGLTLLFGGLLIIDLRLIGVVRQLGFQQANRFVPVALIGFGLNLFSGVLFLFGDPSRYWDNVAFQSKMLLIVVAGLNAMLFNGCLRPVLTREGPPSPHPRRSRQLARLSGALSLCLWTGVVVMGRLIPYVE